MSNLSQLTPQTLWQFFDKICSIPHPSHHEEALAEYIGNWAVQQGLFVERDAVGNILIRKPATSGMEDRQSVVLQAHLDMVPQKNDNTQHDFTKDPIKPYIDGEWVKAEGTTLGADNGIGMASALALLSDRNVVHGPIEVLLTMTEETGMVGAFGLQPGWIQSSILINTDSETEGEVYTGCAGGVDAALSLELIRESAPLTEYLLFKITITGLLGGHSGVDINSGRANANKILVRFLSEYTEQLGLRLYSLNGGTLRNAIPREANAIISVSKAKLQEFNQSVSAYFHCIKTELSSVEPNLRFTASSCECNNLPLIISSQMQLINLINCIPNGVIRMSDDINNVVESSLNIAIVEMHKNNVMIYGLIRSLIDSGKVYVISMLRSLAQLSNATITIRGDYPGWKPDIESPILQHVIDTHYHLFDVKPKIMVIHAGLECGLFKQPYPDVDMISIGPTIQGAHSPDEQVHIASVHRYWQLLTAILKNMPGKV